MTTSAAPKSFVSYLRVSTRQQEASGLGLDAQRDAVRSYIARSGGVLLAEYLEIESGRKSSRPKLREALQHAQATGATLVVAKLDRLARNVLFLATLMESGVDFVACDLPQANKVTLHIMSAIAEAEADFISTRTKEGLRMAKARGRKLGNPANLTATAQARGRRTISQQARTRYRYIAPLCLAWRREGATLEEIAVRLTAMQSELAGTKFYPATVRRILGYAEKWATEDAASSVAVENAAPPNAPAPVEYPEAVVGQRATRGVAAARPARKAVENKTTPATPHASTRRRRSR